MTLGWIVIFFVAGIILLLAEFFLPGLIIGTLGAALILTSGALGVYSYPEYGVWIVLGELLGVAVFIVLGLWIMTRTQLLRGRLTLQTTQQAEKGYVSAASDFSLVGTEAVVITALRPSGTIMVGEKRIDAVSEGVFIEESRRVRIREVQGSRVVVEPAE